VALRARHGDAGEQTAGGRAGCVGGHGQRRARLAQRQFAADGAATTPMIDTHSRFPARARRARYEPAPQRKGAISEAMS
jgi:hypothetical protein